MDAELVQAEIAAVSGGNFFTDNLTLILAAILLLVVLIIVFSVRKHFAVPDNLKHVIPSRFKQPSLVAKYEAHRIKGEGRTASVSDITLPDETGTNHGKSAGDLDFVSNAKLTVRPILNNSAFPVLTILEGATRELGAGFRVMTQVSPNAIIGAQDGDFQSQSLEALSGNTVQFAVLDQFGHAILVVEECVTGIRSGDQYIRHAVKIESLRKAGVTHIEVPRLYSQDDLQLQISDVLAAHISPAKTG